MEETFSKPRKYENGRYDDLLVNKVKMESMHERFLKQYSLVKNLKDLIGIYYDSCIEFSNKNAFKNIKLSQEEKLDKLTLGLNNTNIYIYSYIQSQKALYENLAKFIKEEVISYKLKENADKKEKELFNKSKSVLKEYNNMKINLQKVKTEYYNYFKTLEKMYREIEENKVDKSKNESKIKKTIDYLKILYKKYHDLIKEINRKKVDKINHEKNLLEFYQKSDLSIFNKINDQIWKFIGLITKVNENNIKLMNELMDKYGKINVSDDIKTFINDYSYVKSQEEFFKYEPYIPETKLETEKIVTDEKEFEALNINYRIIAELKKDFNDICPNINMEAENEKCKLREITQRLFNPKVKISEKEINKIISWLPNKQFRTFIIVTLSNQRTKGRYERSWGVVFRLGQILNQILSLAEKEKNYEEAKHCIILSQTFFCTLKGDKRKYYLFEHIKTNKWLKSTQFWDSITDCMIEVEIESNNKVLGQEALEKETTDQRQERQSQVCISQLLTFSENMIDFGLSKEEIDKIIKKKVEKFDIIESYEQLIYEHIDKTLAEKQKNKDFVEEDEISHFVKIRRNSLKIIKKPISLDNIVFNENKEIKNKKKIRKEKSVKLSMKLKLERNTIIQNIKKEIILDKKNLLKISNNKSESTTKNNFGQNKLEIKNNTNIDINNNKSCIYFVGSKRNIDNNINEITKDKNEIIEKNTIEENTIEEPKENKIEENIQENTINEQQPIKKEQKEEKKENNIEENKIKIENDVDIPPPLNENTINEHIEEKQINEDIKKENNTEINIKEENKNEHSEEQPNIEEAKKENDIKQPIIEEHEENHIEENKINDENKIENNIEPPLNEENKIENEKEENK